MFFVSKRIKKITLVLAAAVFTAVFSFAEPSEQVYAQIDQAFEQQDSALLSQLLTSLQSSADYAQYEEYVLKSVRQLIVDNQLDFASSASLAIIDHNLENFDAVELYSSIERARNIEETELRRKRIETAWTR